MKHIYFSIPEQMTLIFNVQVQLCVYHETETMEKNHPLICIVTINDEYEIYYFEHKIHQVHWIMRIKTSFYLLIEILNFWSSTYKHCIIFQVLAFNLTTTSPLCSIIHHCGNISFLVHLQQLGRDAFLAISCYEWVFYHNRNSLVYVLSYSCILTIFLTLIMSGGLSWQSF